MAILALIILDYLLFDFLCLAFACERDKNKAKATLLLGHPISHDHILLYFAIGAEIVEQVLLLGGEGKTTYEQLYLVLLSGLVERRC